MPARVREMRMKVSLSHIVFKNESVYCNVFALASISYYASFIYNRMKQF